MRYARRSKSGSKPPSPPKRNLSLRENAEFHIADRYLVDRGKERRRPEVVNAFALRCFTKFVVGGDHCFFESGINQVSLVRTACNYTAFVFAEFASGFLFDNVQKPFERALFEPFFHSAESNVRKVLKPFEIRNGNTARIDIDIGNDHDAFLLK